MIKVKIISQNLYQWNLLSSSFFLVYRTLYITLWKCYNWPYTAEWCAQIVQVQIPTLQLTSVVPHHPSLSCLHPPPPLPLLSPSLPPHWNLWYIGIVLFSLLLSCSHCCSSPFYRLFWVLAGSVGGDGKVPRSVSSLSALSLLLTLFSIVSLLPSPHLLLIFSSLLWVLADRVGC